MSDTPVPDVNSLYVEIADESVQTPRKAAVTHAADNVESQPMRSARTSPRSTNATVAAKFYDSSPAYRSTTALGDAFAKVELAELADQLTVKKERSEK